ncbi:unnamed protein product [Brassicogethes aeneus]|uniref:Ig-like domain-containing protein n=1 Tax=Brassicogethes aeneus TaxID=1431903 RepID=A0A9P0F9E7_BRAAE|nr:unnamed protein product [Brassicogethes aeneus]
MKQFLLPFVCHLILSGLLQEVACSGAGLKWVRVNVPQYRVPGETAMLQCDYDLGNDTLYAVKWYKEHEEFYRFVPKARPQANWYKVEGVHVDMSKSDSRKVVLHPVSWKTSGLFRCEVSAEAPSFASAQSESRMEVVSEQQLDKTYQPGRSSTGLKKLGRGSTEFDASSERSKRRKTENLRASHSTSELAYATQMSLRASGAPQASSVLKDITTKSPMRASRYQAALKASQKPPTCEIPADLALNLIISGKMTKETYKLMRNLTNTNCGTLVYPSYNKILAAKRRCYPDRSAMTVTETSAEVKLQALLDHISERLLQVTFEDINKLHPTYSEKMQLILKWGCDGSTGQEYKQKFSDKDSSDANIFFTSTVPLQLSVVNENHENIVVWQNPRPSSSRFCRPIRLQFLKESVKSTREEQKYIEQQIRSLLPFYNVHGKKIKIEYKLVFTMIDGKIKNAITETDSSMRCYICKATSKQFNDINLVLKQKVVTENLCFGISSLHAWIRCMEWFLHLAYKCGDETEKKWQARTAEQKQKVAARKQKIQNDFKQLYGLRIDIPKAGSGTTNDGNTARRFFEDVSSTARILGVDEELIAKSKVLLQAISSGFGIDTEKFKVYCLNLAKRSSAGRSDNYGSDASVSDRRRDQFKLHFGQEPSGLDTTLVHQRTTDSDPRSFDSVPTKSPQAGPGFIDTGSSVYAEQSSLPGGLDEGKMRGIGGAGTIEGGQGCGAEPAHQGNARGASTW